MYFLLDKFRVSYPGYVVLIIYGVIYNYNFIHNVLHAFVWSLCMHDSLRIIQTGMCVVKIYKAVYLDSTELEVFKMLVCQLHINNGQHCIGDFLVHDHCLLLLHCHAPSS